MNPFHMNPFHTNPFHMNPSPPDAAGGADTGPGEGLTTNQALKAQHPADTRWFVFQYGGDSLQPFRDEDCQVGAGQLVSWL